MPAKATLSRDQQGFHAEGPYWRWLASRRSRSSRWPIGSTRVKVVPTPSSESTLIVPLCRSMISLVSERPTPRPPATRSLLASERQKRLKTRGMSYLAMPMPVSLTEMSTSLRVLPTETVTVPPSGV